MTATTELNTDCAQESHGMYARLRAGAPVHPVLYEEGVRAWLVTPDADALALRNGPRPIKDPSRPPARFAPVRARPFQASVFKSLLMLDPPEHTRLQGLVVKVFPARTVQRMQPRVAAIANGLLDAIDRTDTTAPVDHIANYVGPLPIRVTSDALGVPADYADRFGSAMGPLISMATNAAKSASGRETIAVLDEVVEYKRRVPTDDLLTSLISASSDGDRPSHEVIATCFLLMSVGYETTVHLIANGALALLNNPLQLKTIRSNPTLIDSAVEEVLRFVGPANITTARYSTAEITVGNVVIPPNEVVFIALQSAIRNGARFHNVDHFDVTGATCKRLAFGHGIHHCLGAPLARMEGVNGFHRVESSARARSSITRPRPRSCAMAPGTSRKWPLMPTPARVDRSYVPHTARRSSNEYS